MNASTYCLPSGTQRCSYFVCFRHFRKNFSTQNTFQNLGKITSDTNFFVRYKMQIFSKSTNLRILKFQGMNVVTNTIQKKLCLLGHLPGPCTASLKSDCRIGTTHHSASEPCLALLCHCIALPSWHFIQMQLRHVIWRP